MKRTYVPSSEFTPEFIEKLKQQHGEIHKLTVEDKAIIVKKPGIKELDFAQTTAGASPFDFNRCILNSCMLAGDVEIIENEHDFLAACSQVAELVKFKTATLVKL